MTSFEIENIAQEIARRSRDMIQMHESVRIVSESIEGSHPRKEDPLLENRLAPNVSGLAPIPQSGTGSTGARQYAYGPWGGRDETGND